MAGELIRVILTGICTFVDADVGDNNRPVTAVFPNAARHEPKHYVNLIISKDDYDVDTNVPVTEDYSSLGKPFYIIRLDGKSIAVAGLMDYEEECEGGDWRGKLCLHRPKLSQKADDENRPTNLEELESVEWIPSLGRSWPRMWPMRTARRMRRGFYSAAADTNLVSASFELPKGKLSSHWVSGDIWEFSPRSMTRFKYRSAVAQEVRFEAKVANKLLHIDVCDLHTRQHCGYVRIRKRSASDKEPIQVVIANVTDKDRLPGGILFCGECGRSECPLGDNDPFPCTCVDHHYALYYNSLLDTPPSRPSLPRRVCTYPPLIPVAMRVGGDNCPPNGYP